MPAKSYNRGWPIIYVNGRWIYEDTRKPQNTERPCFKCGHTCTKDGYDHCIGRIPGVESACCGHGVEDGYILRSDSTEKTD